MDTPLLIDREELADLVEAVAQRADKAAFARLFEHFAPRLKAYLMRLGAANGAAEELAQEVMLTVWRKAASFDRRQSSVSTWMFTVARNRRIDVIRKERRPELPPDEPSLLPVAPQPADILMDEARRDSALRGAILDLPQEQSDLLKLAFYEGKSHAEIAVEQNLPLGTVKSRLRLAFNRLRRIMEPLR